MRGSERLSGEPIVVAFSGTDISRNYLAKKIFASPHREEPLGNTFRWQALNAANRASKDISLFIWDIPQSHEASFKPDASVVLPSWVRMNISLTEHAGASPSAKFKKTRNMVLRNGLTREVTRAPEIFDDFYLNIYLPYVVARHGDAAIQWPHKKARREFLADDRELLLIKKDGRTVGGNVLSYAKGEAHGLIMGIEEGLPTHLKREIGDAVYYHVFIRAMELGHTVYNMGHSRPFLSDGVVEHKRNWGGRLVNARLAGGGLWALRFMRETPALKSFLLHNPFIALDQNEEYHLHGFVETGEGDAVAKAAEYWTSRYCTPGAIDLRLFELTPRFMRRIALP